MKKATYFLAFLIAISACVFGCKSSMTITRYESEVLTPIHFAIDTAFVVRDSLHATVSYSGGCGTHDFTLESAGFLMKSLPPKQPLRIVHRSDGDPCRAMIKEELSFDLQPYRGTPRGVTVLKIENWNKNLSYSYE